MCFPFVTVLKGRTGHPIRTSAPSEGAEVVDHDEQVVAGGRTAPVAGVETVMRLSAGSAVCRVGLSEM
jgi:hypothetical protein